MLIILFTRIAPWTYACMPAKLLQLCLTLGNAMDCSPPGSSVHGDTPVKNTGVGSHCLLQGIFPTQEWNVGLSYCRQILYHLSHQFLGINIILHLIFELPRPSVGLMNTVNRVVIRGWEREKVSK